jgi:hypothetical protein
MICSCGAPAVVIAPGDEPERCDLFLLSRGVPERRWCWQCARSAGWPWLSSESQRPARKAGAA